MMRLSHYNGNPYLGVYCAANEFLALVPRDSSPGMGRDIAEVLEVKIEMMSVAGTNLIGSLVSMNSFGAVMSNMVGDAELEFLSRFLPVYRIEDKINASGNNILANDFGAIANPDLSEDALRAIEQTLQVPALQMSIADHKTVGSACVATNKGVLCHPSTSSEEMEAIRRFLKVPAAIGTLNYGAPLVGACMIANSKGAVVGNKSTPIELGRVEDALYLV
jgi:translation initiation factor 6